MATLTSITVLGSTGSIGVNTLDVVDRHRDRFRIFALAANKDHELMLQQCLKFEPKFAVMADEAAANKLSVALSNHGKVGVEVLAGQSALQEISAAEECDAVMAGIVGAAGLLPTLAAAKAGKRILLANKESLVMAGKLLMDAASNSSAVILPVDSEHNAIWQCLPAQSLAADHKGDVQSLRVSDYGVEKILLTASGGPFREMPIADMVDVSPDQACAHPNWDMGRKISVDSATMMNKGLELIEACWLFNLQPSQIEIVIHPESVIHSLVAYSDGSVLAQLGNPDMRTPIAYALSWPERIGSGVEPLNLIDVASLSFAKPEFERYPCLKLAYTAVHAGGTASVVLNAANEVAVEKFLDKQIGFTDIAKVVDSVLQSFSIRSADSLDIILEDDSLARESASRVIASLH